MGAARQFWDECGSFWRETRRTFRTTGAVLPSSRVLAAALAAPLRGPRGPLRILEVGPGTGSVTRALLRRLQPGDQLDAVELNSQFAAKLQRIAQSEPLFQSHGEQFRVIEAAVEDLPGTGEYDLIVSCLPLNSFAPDGVRAVFRAYRRLLAPGGRLVYFEYAGVRRWMLPLASRADRARLCRVGWVLARYIRHYQQRRQSVLWNVPPAVVRHLRFDAV